ncbi:hypothetical protein J3459_010869 [Metarhizium acridum]|uniref:uncharacterized protein n=1 Tax=Metarhizium acridum TaxID=92637 RepID=UPI001C6B40BE|nr:hypothetical protein J3458_019701 [Metarhizium acridum]KAG8420653.1 hypothetical protein J3459_010869 [Metarhizium acridum]
MMSCRLGPAPKGIRPFLAWIMGADVAIELATRNRQLLAPLDPKSLHLGPLAAEVVPLVAGFAGANPDGEASCLDAGEGDGRAGARASLVEPRVRICCQM